MANFPTVCVILQGISGFVTIEASMLRLSSRTPTAAMAKLV